ncbi:TolC family protein [Tautonia plasticadhaerens]|uniref:Cobalt-zinc-cadmium resistance protein CzcC n=1 Tax=Tautonia plasticadhaerens TaxID=2527974 RepID=A0A518H4S1_9BACT|nr:TolC family protein [Tautonia plasticadhaerens]QDV35832.1 Cobalt-zinc-cadmium resistance protein CzcC precursor [Tautonia plasticadhaerens]
MTMLWLVAIAFQAVPPVPPPLPDARPMEASTRIGPGPDAPPGSSMGLADLERIALEHNPTVAQAAERIGQSLGNADQAGRPPNPFFAWNSQSIGAGGTIGTQGGFLQQQVVTGGKLRISRRGYEVDVEAARWALAAQRQRVVNGVRLRFWQTLAAQGEVQLRRDLVSMAEEVVLLVREKVETGHASEADLLLAENDAEQHRIDLDQIRNRSLNTWREFAAFLGRPGMPPARLEGDLERDAIPFSWEPTLARLLVESPEVKVAELNVVRAGYRLRRQEVEPIPDLILRGGAAHDPDSHDTLGIVRVYVDLPLWDRNQGNIVTARHALVDVRRDLDRIRLSIEQRLARRYNQVQTSQSNVRRFRDRIIPNALRAFELYSGSFRDEDASYSRVQSSLGAYADATIKYLRQIEELRNAETAIVGMLLVEEGSVEGGTPRPPGGGIPNSPPGGGAPVGSLLPGGSG